jgi:U3 small nucleolar RNA-associated protein 14
VKRQSGFEKAKADLGRWDNVVVANKVADQLEFPLKTSSLEVNDDNANGFKVFI